MKRIKFDLIVEDFGECNFSGKAWETNNHEYVILLNDPETAETTLIHELIHILQYAKEYDFINDCMQEIVTYAPEYYHNVLDYVKETYGSPVDYREVEAKSIEIYIKLLCDDLSDESVRYFDFLTNWLASDYDILLIPEEIFKSYDNYLDKDSNVSYTLDLNKKLNGDD